MWCRAINWRAFKVHVHNNFMVAEKVYGINVKQQRRDIEFRRPTHGVVDKRPPTGDDLMVTSRAVKRGASK